MQRFSLPVSLKVSAPSPSCPHSLIVRLYKIPLNAKLAIFSKNAMKITGVGKCGGQYWICKWKWDILPDIGNKNTSLHEKSKANHNAKDGINKICKIHIAFSDLNCALRQILKEYICKWLICKKYSALSAYSLLTTSCRMEVMDTAEADSQWRSAKTLYKCCHTKLSVKHCIVLPKRCRRMCTDAKMEAPRWYIRKRHHLHYIR